MTTTPERPTMAYAWYALGVMTLVYTVSFVDRQILSILAEKIKRDLDLDDAQLGFLYGTAFAIFYTIFGIPLGRLADRWYRGRLMALGLAVWSAMTALSGFASTYGQLAAARVGVGVGEASASPAAFSMLASYFSTERRALAMAIYTSGVYLGMGLSLPIGGWVSDGWDRAVAAGRAPFDLAGWQVAFLVVGLPGLIIAAWVWTLREPARVAPDGSAVPVAMPGAWRAFVTGCDRHPAAVHALERLAVSRRPACQPPHPARRSRRRPAARVGDGRSRAVDRLFHRRVHRRILGAGAPVHGSTHLRSDLGHPRGHLRNPGLRRARHHHVPPSGSGQRRMPFAPSV